MPKKLKKASKKVGKAIVKGANAISNAAGAKDLVDYTSSKIAKSFVKKQNRQYVKDTTSGSAAMKSAGRLGLTIGTLAAGGVAGGVAKAAKAAKASRNIKAGTKMAVKIPGQAKKMKITARSAYKAVSRKRRPVKFKITRR